MLGLSEDAMAGNRESLKSLWLVGKGQSGFERGGREMWSGETKRDLEEERNKVRSMGKTIATGDIGRKEKIELR